MKNMVKHIGLAAIVAAIAISMTALSLAGCGDDSGGGGGGGGDDSVQIDPMYHGTWVKTTNSYLSGFSSTGFNSLTITASAITVDSSNGFTIDGFKGGTDLDGGHYYYIGQFGFADWSLGLELDNEYHYLEGSISSTNGVVPGGSITFDRLTKQ